MDFSLIWAGLIALLLVGALVLGYVLSDNQDLRRKLLALAHENKKLQAQVEAPINVIERYVAIERSSVHGEERWRVRGIARTRAR